MKGWDPYLIHRSESYSYICGYDSDSSRCQMTSTVSQWSLVLGFIITWVGSLKVSQRTSQSLLLPSYTPITNETTMNSIKKMHFLVIMNSEKS